MTSMSLDIARNPAGLSNEDILKFPFPYKLWIVISLPTANFLYWNNDGTIIQVNLQRLQEYLHSSKSIFVIKTSSKFLKHLEDFQFKRLNESDTSEGAEAELSFQHKHFQRHRLDLVAKIRRVTFFNLDNAQNAEMEATASNSSPSLGAARMRGDLCFMEHGFLTEMQKKRIQSETVFAFARESRVLQEKLKKSESTGNTSSNNKRGRSACLEREQIVILPKELYENPHESVLAGKGGFQGFRYGGYYGNCTVEQIDAFFGDYLPKYGEGGILKVKNFKDGSDESSQQVKSPKPDNETDSSLPVGVATILENTMTNSGEISMDVESFISTHSNDTTNPTEPSHINISATFNCNNGSMEYNITECPKEVILAPSFEGLNIIATNPVNEVGSPIVQVLTATDTNRQQDENTDFYDDLRATFELLQNQSF